MQWYYKLRLRLCAWEWGSWSITKKITWYESVYIDKLHRIDKCQQSPQTLPVTVTEDTGSPTPLAAAHLYWPRAGCTLSLQRYSRFQISVLLVIVCSPSGSVLRPSCTASGKMAVLLYNQLLTEPCLALMLLSVVDGDVLVCWFLLDRELGCEHKNVEMWIWQSKCSSVC